MSNEEQAKQLEDSLQFIKQHETQMKRCLEQKGKLLDAIKHASTLLAELRTSSLTPKQYYELYIAAFDALSYLGNFLKEDHANHHLADIYELVQYAGNIVPRLYLMITVGAAYMSVADAPIKEIMKDMIEMCRGVQHPIRGLFLRYYLCQSVRDYLPVGGSEGPEGNLQDSVRFIITNFIEMNKLWVRLQHQGLSRDRDKRTKERQELQILVGSNLVRLSQLEGIDRDYYRNLILPSISEQIVQCRDVLAQEYLLDVICQIFPDDFHLYTLDLFLGVTGNLNPSVSIKKILLTLINRLADYVQREREANGGSLGASFEKLIISNGSESSDSTVTDSVKQRSDSTATDTVNGTNSKLLQQDVEDHKGAQGATADDEEIATVDKDDKDNKDESRESSKSSNLFIAFWNHLQRLIQVRPDIPTSDVAGLLVGIARLSLACYPDNKDYIDSVLQFALKMFNDDKLSDEEVSNSINDLLLVVLQFYSDIDDVLKISSYYPLLDSQLVSTQKSVAGAVLDSLLKENTKITTVETAKGVFQLLEIIIKEGSASSTPEGVPGGLSTATSNLSNSISSSSQDEDSDDVQRDQSRLAKVIHLLSNEDPDQYAKLLSVARRSLADGHVRIKYTFPALITNASRLIRRYYASRNSDKEWFEKIVSTFKFTQSVISELYKVGKADLALRLYINSASVADQVKAEESSYEFFAQAFSIYEEAISDSRSQYQSICIIIGALQNTRNFSKDNYDTLISKSALYASKLLKKPDQCRAVYLASHLWWAVEIPARGEEEGKVDLFKDDKRVLECLQRALRVADACMDVAVSVELFVEILNRYLYYFDRGCTSVTVKYIVGLIELIQNNLNNADESISESPRKHFERTIKFIEDQKESDDKFQDIVW